MASSSQKVYVQCKKCGHVPNGCPAMACSKCKNVGPDWTPLPFSEIQKSQNAATAAQRQQRAALEEAETLRASVASLSSHIRSQQSELEKIRDLVQVAAMQKESYEIACAQQGAHTKAKQSALVQSANLRVKDLEIQCDDVKEAIKENEKKLEALNREKAELMSRQARLKAERDAQSSANEKVQAAMEKHLGSAK